MGKIQSLFDLLSHTKNKEKKEKKEKNIMNFCFFTRGGSLPLKNFENHDLLAYL